MQIRLRKIVPTFFERDKIINSEIWEQEVILKKSEHLHIIAPSGKGKTSLIHFIYGLRKDYEGTVSYENENIRNISPEKFSTYRQKNISIIFQDLRLFADQKVRENLEIKRQLQPYHPPHKIDEMATRLGIESKL